MAFDKKLIKDRSKKLEEARAYLKTQFVGIDTCIDKFINSVKIWYIMPELQTRPLIVNLWGITGVGKTDLIRKFVNFIEFSDRFCEIQLDSREGSATIEDYLENTLDHNSSGLLLLDEIQRFRSVNEEMKENNSSKYQDLWMLLSDGVLQSNSKIKEELLRMVLEEEYWEERYDNPAPPKNKEDEDKNKQEEERRKKFKYKMYYYEANKLKKLLKLDEDVNTIMTWDKEKKIKIIQEKIKSKEIYEGKKYSKLLIVISGNLDEAFQVAGNVDDADLDADVYHEYSKTIDIVKIKGALKLRFKPEQIARFGNIHIIYPILNRTSNMQIIKQKVDIICANIKQKHSIDIEFDRSVHEVVYANGVFPVQGLRPLLSTISAIVENSIPIFLFEYLNKGVKGKLVISHKDGKLTANISGKKISYEIPRVLDDIRKNTTKNKLSLVAVHEAGHAVAYALLNKVAPTQIVASTTDSHSEGFIGTHKSLGSKVNSINRIIVNYAGRAAEELIFGKEYVTTGAVSDFQNATSSLTNLVKNAGLGSYTGVYVVNPNNKSMLDSHKEIDVTIENMAKSLYAQSLELLRNNMDFLLVTSEELFANKKIEPDDFVKLAKPFVEDIAILNSGDNLEVDFHAKFRDALRNKKGQIRWKKSEAVALPVNN